MQGRILYMARLDNSIYERADFTEFYKWAKRQTSLQIDIETDIQEKWPDFTLISIQFGSCQFEDRRQYFFQWSELIEDQKIKIKEILENTSIQKLAHNMAFEYINMKFNGITIENIYDTMIAEKVLRGGLENMNYALADISYKYLRIIMDKTEQTNFGDNIITDPKILYGCTDVMYLDIIKRLQIEEASKPDKLGHDQLGTLALEMEALPGFCDMTFNGMGMNPEKWRENIRLAEPLVIEAEKTLNSWLFKEPFYSHALEKGYVSEKDRCVINFESPQQRTELIQLLFPLLIGGTKPIIKKYIRDNGKELSFNDMNLLQNYMGKNYELMEGRLIDQHRDYLINKGYLIPANQVTINWNSQPQVLGLIQTAIPKLRSLSEEEVAKFAHPILDARSEYTDSNKLITTYGEEFLRKHIDRDGKVRTNFNTVVSTGRISSSRPNMQNIPAKDSVGTRYRNAFIPDEGWVFVDSDYTGQELALIAFASKDPVWIKAITEGKDLHSVCAELVFGRDWKDAAEEGKCQYYFSHVDKKGNYFPANSQLKCDCKKHKVLRTAVKTINFGLAYGMSEIKLSGTLKISRQEAINLIEDYFRVFPGIKKTLDFLGQFGIRNGYIQTFAPFWRKRWFPFWYEHRPYIEAHISGIKYHPTLGEIERASKNMPFQGSGADMTKIAVTLIRTEIKKSEWSGKVKLSMQVHDQITTSCLIEIADDWKVRMDELMCEAANVIVTTGILKAETAISPVWTK